MPSRFDQLIDNGDAFFTEVRGLIDTALAPEFDFPAALENDIHEFSEHVEEWHRKFLENPTPETVLEILSNAQDYQARTGVIDRLREAIRK